jgi:hypothetical protein
LQLYADGGYQLRIRSLEGTPNYGPRQNLMQSSPPPPSAGRHASVGPHSMVTTGIDNGHQLL